MVVTGDTYERYLHEKLFKPAGMMNTGYLIPKFQKEDLAHGYQENGHDWGSLLDHPWAEDGPYWNLRANGGILSTVGDLYKWHQALMGTEILSEVAKKKYFAPHMREGPGANSYYGYGWVNFETNRGTRLLAHNGGNNIFFADFHRYIDEGVVMIVASNAAGRSIERYEHLLLNIIF